jgi:choline dehydrogenase-like flavoprotein
MNNDCHDCDVIVVGTGPGGAMVARDLALKGKKVLILERGGRPVLRGSFLQYLLYQCIPGHSMLFTPQLLGMVRGLTAGGSSVFYYGTCFPVPFEMLKSHGIDIASEVKELKKELPIAPLKDGIMGPKAKLIKDTAQKLGYSWEKLDKFMYQDRWTRDQKHGDFYYGDPNNVKWSARVLVDEAVADGAKLVTKARVDKVIIENGQARGVEYRHAGKVTRAFAPVVVVAAGGIGSPVILRKSGFADAGYDYFFDPLISVVGYVKGMGNDKELPMSAGALMHDEGYVMTDMALPKMLNTVFALAALRFHRLFSHKRAVRIMIKARDTLGGRLTDSGGVRKWLVKEDREKLEKGYRRAREILEKAGASGIYKTWKLAAHPGGTVKIGEILDADLQTRKVKNLYVCDCSVIPEAWGLPPTLTILGLSKRLAKKLAGKKTKKYLNKNSRLRAGNGWGRSLHAD